MQNASRENQSTGNSENREGGSLYSFKKLNKQINSEKTLREKEFLVLSNRFCPLTNIQDESENENSNGGVRSISFNSEKKNRKISSTSCNNRIYEEIKPKIKIYGENQGSIGTEFHRKTNFIVTSMVKSIANFEETTAAFNAENTGSCTKNNADLSPG